MVAIGGFGYEGSVLAPIVDPSARLLSIDEIVGDPSLLTGISAAPPKTVVTWSMGALYGLQLAADFGIPRVVIISGTCCFLQRPDYTCGVDRAEFRALRAAVKRDATLALNTFTRSAVGVKAAAAFSQYMLKSPSPQRLLQALDQLEHQDLRTQSRLLQAKVLVLHGSDDVIIPIAQGRFLAQLLPNSTFREVSGGSHAPWLERESMIREAVASFAV